MALMVWVTDERAYRTALKHAGFVIYDHLYPFRLASNMILRLKGSKTRPPVSEDLARFISSGMNDFFPREFIFNYFVEWYQETRPTRPVAIFGTDPSMRSECLDRFKHMGVLVVSDTPGAGDVLLTGPTHVSDLKTLVGSRKLVIEH